MWTSLFPSRAAAWIRQSGRRARRRAATLRATRLGSWETLGLGLGGEEMLERRSMMAADLSVSFDDNVVAEIDKTFYAPGSQVVYKLVVENTTAAAVNGAKVTTTLSNKIDLTRVSWSAAYSGGAGGLAVGASDVNTAVNLPVGGKVVFTITGSVKADATGDLVSKADVAKVPGASNAKTDTNTFVPRSIVLADGPGFTAANAGGGRPRISLANPATGATIASAVTPFAANVRTGVRAALGDLDGDGKVEMVTVSGYGQPARIAVFKQLVAADGKVTLERDARYDLLPFGPGYTRGLSLAVGDFSADGRADVAVAKSIDDGAVRVYQSTPASPTTPLSLFTSFAPFPGGAGGKGGAGLAAADFGTFSGATVVDASRGDAAAELAVASGVGLAPTVKIYSLGPGKADVVRTVNPFTPSFRGGMDITTARVNADSIPDLIFAQGFGGNSEVQVINGRVDTAKAATTLAKYTAFADLSTRAAAVSIAGVETGADGRANVIQAGQLGGHGRNVRRLDATTGAVVGNVSGLTGDQRIAAPLSRIDTGTFTTASGLQVTRLWAPSGTTSPTDSSSVTVDYIGCLLKDGTIFDSGTNSTFSVSGVVPGFREALKLMKIGEAVKVVIPAALGYGTAGKLPSIPADADLVFYIRLASFK